MRKRAKRIQAGQPRPSARRQTRYGSCRETAKEPFGLEYTTGLGQRNGRHCLGRLQSLLTLRGEDQLP